jgi:peptidoglycan-N-acetylglucosamine deacetylase
MSKLISLSFDDGPNSDLNDSTMDQMLDILQKHNVKASFFLIGNKIRPENEKVIKRAFDMGCDIENHSWSHPAFSNLTPEQMMEEYNKCDERIIQITGKKPEFFRAPYIAVNQQVFDTIKTPFIQGFGCEDWENDKDADYRFNKLYKNAADGLIILLHVMEGNKYTLEATDRLIPALQKKGYEFVTVPELFKRKGVNPQRPAYQWNNILS